MIYLIEAMEAVKAQRKAEEKKMPGIRSFNRKHSMLPGERDILGAHFHAFASEIGEPFDHARYGVSYRIPVVGGTYTAHYDPLYGVLFGRFDPIDGIQLPKETDRTTGKWTIRTDTGDEGLPVFESWRKQLQQILKQR
jgi:hypothetical protein